MTYDTSNIPAVLWERFELLDGCQGEWLFLVEEDSPYFHYQCRSETERPIRQAFLPWRDDARNDIRNLPDAIRYAMAAHWRGIAVVFQPRYLDDRYGWPGGYDPEAVLQANANVWREEYGSRRFAGETSAGAIILDPRYLIPTPEEDQDAIDDLTGLEDYPCLSEDELGQVEHDRETEAWEASYGLRRDFRKALVKVLEAFYPDTPLYWAEETIDAVSDEVIDDLARALEEQTNTYWCHESDGSAWLDVNRLVAGVDAADFRDLTGLPILAPDQQWRTESYPWPDGSTTPLAPLPY